MGLTSTVILVRLPSFVGGRNIHYLDDKSVESQKPIRASTLDGVLVPTFGVRPYGLL